MAVRTSVVPVVVASVLLLAAGAGCGATSDPDQPAGVGRSAASRSATGPSPAAAMVCADEANSDIIAAIGVAPTAKPTSTWSDSLFSCTYRYPTGTLVLTVKDLPDLTAATTYYTARRVAATEPVDIPAVGQAAFSVSDGSLFVRKDSNVLQVDVSGLPAQFGSPPHPRGVVAITIGSTIMHCWTQS